MFICYIFLFIGIGDIIYYLAYYDRVHNLNVTDVILWMFTP
jgi:hypothetical protein